MADITLLEVIHLGYFTDTYKAFRRNQFISAKKLRLFSLNTEEQTLLLRLKHENIVEIYGFDQAFILLEYVEGVSLEHYVHGKEQPEYNVTDALHWMHQVAKGLAFVHSLDPQLVYGCLKIKNLLLYNNFRCLKIAGLPIRMTRSEYIPLNEYISPEVIKRDKELTQKCDVYSFGVILWQLMSRKKPYYQLNFTVYELANVVVKGERPLLNSIKIPDSWYIEKFIELCWSSDVRKRPTTEQLVSDVNECLTISKSRPNQLLKRYLGTVECIEDITFLEEIGEGAFGVSHRALWNKRNIAVKKLNNFANTFENRIREIMFIKHVNILQIHGIAKDTDSIYLLTDYSECGSLFSYLHGEEQREYSVDNALNWMSQVSTGICYLHEGCKLYHIIHGSLKPQNLLFFCNFELLKISDYCSPVNQETLLKSNSEKASIAYIAPEVMDGEPSTEKSDVYSFGILLWEVMSRKKPYYYLEYLQSDMTITNFRRGQRPVLSEIRKSKFKYIEEMIELCWAEYPEKRPTVKNLLEILRCPQFFDLEFAEFKLKSLDFADIKFFPIIGLGSFGNVRITQWRGNNVAIKKCQDIITDIDKETFINFKEDIKQLSHYVHENIIRLYDIYIYGEFPYLLMELAECGSLYDFLHGDEQKEYTLPDGIDWMIQCAKGISHLHAMKPKSIIHSNLKSHSILLTNNYRTVKIGGFGIITHWDTYEWKKYVAPEVFNKNGNVTEKCDIYSLGTVLWEVVTRLRPLDCLSINLNILEFEEIKIIIENCWNSNPDKRPSATNLIGDLKQFRSTFDTKFKKFKSEVALTVDFKDIVCSERVGGGSFGDVYKATWRNKEIALKKCRDCFGGRENLAMQNFEKEVKYLSRAEHENVVKLYGITFDEEFPCLLMDFAECGSLYNYLHGDERREYSIADGIDWMMQCLKGISHLHHMSPKPIVHRDLKTHNLVLTDNYRILKICDFGTATELKTLMSKDRGTSAYVAPEVLKAEKYTEKCDIYSFGIILWEVMTRQKPYQGWHSFAIMINTAEGKRPQLSCLSMLNCKHLQTLITNCWNQNPTLRPTVEEIELRNISYSNALIK